MAASELRLQAGPLTLAAVRHGPTQAATKVLALHGWLDNAASFAPLAAELVDLDLVALDLPGHGRSQHRGEDAWYHFVDYLTDLDRVLDALGWSDAVLLGHSMGAALASLYAGLRPQRVRQLWLIEGLGPMTTPAVRYAAALKRALDERLERQDTQLRLYADQEQAVAARMSANGLSADAARLLVDRGLREVDGGLVWSTDPRLRLTSAQRLAEEHCLAVISEIACPALLVAAEPVQPYLPPMAEMERRVACVVGLRVERLAGNHYLHMDRAAQVAQVISTFSNAVDGNSR